MSQAQDIAEQNIQMWKVKKLIKSLDAARGCRPQPPLSRWAWPSDTGVLLEPEPP